MAVLAGEAAVRVVPTLRKFHERVDSELKRRPHSLDVQVNPDLKKASAELDAWRKKERLNAVNVPVRADFKEFHRSLSQVEHIFKRSSLSRAIRLNIKVVGIQALPALAYAAGSAASGLDALGKSAFALPGLLGGALASVGALATGLNGVGDALKAYGEDAADAADNARKARDADRDLLRAKRDLRDAIRDQRREIEDLNSEMRRASLNEADAILNVQEAVERLREGGFRSVTEFQRAQLNLLSSVDRLNEVRKNTARTAQDVSKANVEGIQGSDRVVDALDRVAEAADRLDESQVSKVSEALAKLSPNARSTVEAIHSFSDEWGRLQSQVQDNLFRDLDQAITDLGNRGLPTLQAGLSRVATGLNANFKSIATSLGGAENLSFLDRIFGNTEGGLKGVARGMEPLLNGFLRLTEVSSRSLPRLGDAFTRLMGRFDAFVTAADGDGRLEKWIDQGLDGLTSLGNSALNLVSIISSVGEAFNAATNTQGGFIGSLESITGRLADFLKSTEGQNTLVSYFQKAKDFAKEFVGVLGTAWDLFTDFTEAVRQVSTDLIGGVGLFDIARAFFNIAGAIERTTGVLKPLVATYILFRTAKPFVEGLTTAWKNYGKVVGSLSSYGPTQGVFGNANRGMKQFQSGMSSLTGVMSGATSKFQLNASAVKDVDKRLLAAFGPANNLTKQFDKLGAIAGTAGTKVGGASAGSLGFALRGLGSFIAPTAVFTGAVIGLTTLITKLGEAHASAAQDAAKQKASLDQLKSSLDSVTGATTMQTLNQNARALKSYDIPGQGNRDILSDFARTGVGSPEQILAATIPSQQPVRNDLLADLDKQTADKISGSEMWQRYRGLWESNGISLETLAKAANGDPASKSKVEGVRKKLLDPTGKGMVPDWVPGSGEANRLYESSRVAGGFAPPDLTQTINQSGAHDSATSAIAIRDLSQAAVDEGNLLKGASDLAYGRGALNDAGKGILGPDGAVTLDPNGNAIVQTSIEPRIAPELGTITKTPFGWSVALTEQGTSQYVQKFAGGGVVQGKGTGTSDSNLAMLSRGEFVTRQKAVDHYGQTFFDDLNNMRLPKFDAGGFIGPRIQPPRPIISTPAPSIFAGVSAPAPKPVPRPAPGPALSGAPRAGGNPLTAFGGGPAPHSRPITPTPPPPTRNPGTRIPLNPRVQSWRDSADALPGRVAGWFGNQFGRGPDNPGKRIAVNPRVQGWIDSANAFPGKIPGYLGRWATGPHGPGLTPGAPGVRLTPDQLLSNMGLPGIKPPTPARPAPKPASKPAPIRRGAPSGEPMTLERANEYRTSQGLPPVAPSAPHGGSATPGIPAPAGPSLPFTTPIAAPSSPLSFTAPAVGAIPGGGAVALDPVEQGLQTNTLRVKRAVDALFKPNGPLNYSGVRPDALKWHPNGLALDVGIPNWNTPEGKARGDEIFAYFNANKEAFGIDYILWQEKDHFDHLHINTTGGGLPGGGDLGGIPTSAILPGILQQAGLPPGLLPGGQTGGIPGLPPHLQPQAVTDFLSGTAQDVGSQLSQIGLGFLGGVTGLDFSSLANAGQQIGNHALSLSGSGSSGGGSGLNAEAQANIDAFINGEGPTSLSPDVLSSLGVDPSTLGLSGSSRSSGGAERWRPLVRQILQQVAPNYGITNLKAWEDALVRQIDTESSGDPSAFNGSDSNGRGGTQQVAGLLQFLPETFAAHNISGGEYTDPVAQIYAAIDYVANKYGMDGNGAPLQIGRGVGYKSGGHIKGKGGTDSILARVSRGEYLNSARSVKHYGPGLFASLNAMQIPKDSLPGFNTGGMPLPPLFPQPTPQPTPQPAPQPAPQSGQSAGPLPSPSASAGAAAGLAASVPSTGGAAGPGATAPAPAPSALPQVNDALAGIGGGLGMAGSSAGGLAQPGATPSNEGDNRGTLGAAPTSQQHNNPALSAGIKAGASHIGSLLATAASMAASGASMGASGAMGGAGAGTAGAGIQAGAAIAGEAIDAGVNILSSFLVGNVTGGSTAQASGVPLLPQRAPMQTGVPPVQNDNRTYNLTNLDAYKQMQARDQAQQQMPFLSKF